ncbi:MAG: DUF2974 domain-containing protein [Paludibacter sp.]|nr:DUF2974 domain-containing protein [Paludibacter sp.]
MKKTLFTVIILVWSIPLYVNAQGDCGCFEKYKRMAAADQQQWENENANKRLQPFKPNFFDKYSSAYSQCCQRCEAEKERQRQIERERQRQELERQERQRQEQEARNRQIEEHNRQIMEENARRVREQREMRAEAARRAKEEAERKAREEAAEREEEARQLGGVIVSAIDQNVSQREGLKNFDVGTHFAQDQKANVSVTRTPINQALMKKNPSTQDGIIIEKNYVDYRPSGVTLSEVPILADSSPSYAERKKEQDENERNRLFNIDSLLSQKKALEVEYMEMLDLCKNAKSDYACLNLTKPIVDKMEAINQRIEGREEWKNKVKNMSPEELKLKEDTMRFAADMAKISDCAYHTNDFPDGYHPVQDENLSKIINRANTDGEKIGFECVLLKTDDNHYVIAFRGTDDIFKSSKEGNADKINGWTGLLDSDMPQTKLAKSVTNDIVKTLTNPPYNIDKDKIVTTGHSLGGHLAAEAALHSDLSAYTFNSMDISKTTKIEIAEGKIKDASKITNYVSVNDPLNGTPVGFCDVGKNATGGVSNSTVSYPDISSGMTKKAGGEFDYPTKTVKIKYGNTIVIKENNEGHVIKPLYQALEQRDDDLKEALEKNK